MKSLGLVLSCLTLCASAAAGIAPTPGTQDIQVVFNDADLVCNCSVESTRFTRAEWAESGSGRVQRRYGVAEIHINEVYKSTVPAPSRFSLEYIDNELTKGERAVMFLRSSGSSVYAPADPFVGITAFTLVPSGSQGTGIQMLEFALLRIVKSPNHDDQMNALKLLQGFPTLSQSTLSALDRLLSSPSPDIALATFAVILKVADVEHVEKLRIYLSGYRAEMEPTSILSIGSELGHIRDEAALPSLGELSGSRLLSIRIGSMQALRAIKSSKAGPAIVRRLDDSDGYVKYLAVISLAEIFNKYGDYAPNMYLFDRNPGFYVSLWKSWWTTEGQAYQPGDVTR